jgi:NTE family protein
MTTAWILPGGASFGAVQVGVAEALLDHGIVPDLLLGASIGALNAAWLAHDPSPRGAAGLRRIWLNLRRSDVLPLRPTTVLSGLVGLGRQLIDNDRLSRWLRQTVPYDLIEDANVGLTVAATDLALAEPVFLEHGDVVTALLASAAMPGLLPPVRIADRWLVDGWLLANAPLGYAVERGADTVYVLPCGGLEPYQPTTRRRPVLTRLGVETDHNHSRALAEHGVPRGAGAIGQAVIGALVARSVRQEFLTWTPRCEVYLPPAPSVDSLSQFSFSEVRGLMDAARSLAGAWLPGARPLTEDDLTEPKALAGVFD